MMERFRARTCSRTRLGRGESHSGRVQLDRRRGCRQPTSNGVDTLHPGSGDRVAKKEGGLSRVEILQGTLDFIILQTLRWGPRHGYGIAQMIRASSDDALRVDTGSLYPALHRLERKQWIE